MQDFFVMLPVVCGIVVFILNMIRTYKSRSRGQRFIEKARQNGCTVQAIRVDTWTVAGREDSQSMEGKYPTLWALYLYRVNGKKYTRRLGTKIGPGDRNYVHPQTITIYYKKGNPRKAITTGEATDSVKMERGCLVSVLYAFLVMYALMWILQKTGLVNIGG